MLISFAALNWLDAFTHLLRIFILTMTTNDLIMLYLNCCNIFWVFRNLTMTRMPWRLLISLIIKVIQYHSSNNSLAAGLFSGWTQNVDYDPHISAYIGTLLFETSVQNESRLFGDTIFWFATLRGTFMEKPKKRSWSCLLELFKEWQA